MSKLNFYLSKLIEGINLPYYEAEELFQIIINGGATTGQIGAILTSLKIKGESAEELLAYINNLLAKSSFTSQADVNIVSLNSQDNRNFESLLFTSSLIAAQAGLKINKYFNKSLSYLTNTLKFLSNLGINYKKLTPALLNPMFNNSDFVIINTDYIKRIYNINEVIETVDMDTDLLVLPNICLPSLAHNLVIFVKTEGKANIFAKMLSMVKPSINRAWIIYNDYNSCELLKDEPNYILEVSNNSFKNITLDLKRYKFQPLQINDSIFNANYAREIIFGKRNDFYNQVLLYASLHLMVVNNTTLEETIYQVEEIVQSGSALALLSKLINLSNMSEEAKVSSTV